MLERTKRALKFAVYRANIEHDKAIKTCKKCVTGHMCRRNLNVLKNCLVHYLSVRNQTEEFCKAQCALSDYVTSLLNAYMPRTSLLSRII